MISREHHFIPFLACFTSAEEDVESNPEQQETKITMEKNQLLTPAELEAKSFVLNMIKNATSKPCDIGDGAEISAALPRWYDEQKFKRGQKYFLENRYGILSSNMCGLLILLADPKGLDVLDSTKRSSTVETAKKRSWASLNRIRKMHLLASNSASKKQIGLITQSELVLTTFGFMGFALVRPHLLGIRCNNKNKEDREGFVHFWAVIGHMIGVEEQYNMCLFDIETVEHICTIIVRYFFIPTIQLETEKFKEMTNALLNGLSPFMPHMSYEIQMFLVKRIVGVPGYQYQLDMTKETLCKRIFSAEELETARKVIRSMYREKEHYLRMYEIFFDDGIAIAKKCNIGSANSEHDECVQICGKTFHWIMRSKDVDEWKDHLNDAAFYALSKWDRLTIRWIVFMFRCYANLRLARYVCELALNVILFLMRRFYNSM